MNASSWPMFLLRTLNGAEMAPAAFFKKVRRKRLLVNDFLSIGPWLHFFIEDAKILPCYLLHGKARLLFKMPLNWSVKLQSWTRSGLVHWVGISFPELRL